MKAIEIIHPITGQPCFTRHPEELKARYAEQIQKAFTLEIKRLREESGMCYWNGAVRDIAAMKRPGEVRS
jgi:hypothetical protein